MPCAVNHHLLDGWTRLNKCSRLSNFWQSHLLAQCHFQNRLQTMHPSMGLAIVQVEQHTRYCKRRIAFDRKAEGRRFRISWRFRSLPNGSHLKVVGNWDRDSLRERACLPPRGSGHQRRSFGHQNILGTQKACLQHVCPRTSAFFVETVYRKP